MDEGGVEQRSAAAHRMERSAALGAGRVLTACFRVQVQARRLFEGSSCSSCCDTGQRSSTNYQWELASICSLGDIVCIIYPSIRRFVGSEIASHHALCHVQLSGEKEVRDAKCYTPVTASAIDPLVA